MTTFDDTYLYKSPHITPRVGITPKFVIWHETAGNARSSLAWLIDPESRVSWDYLIGVDGTIYRCNNPALGYTWHAGVARARGYDEVNQHSIGVEVEGPNDGTPITTAQRDSIVILMIYLRDEFGIPLDRAYHLGHKEIALPKGRKTDPRAYSVDVALTLAKQAATVEPPAPAIDLAAFGQELQQLEAIAEQLQYRLGLLKSRIATTRQT